tara:strand:- start:629 stop:997 length:369 start_codon:yes stop_codon:yes gene_type:complete
MDFVMDGKIAHVLEKDFKKFKSKLFDSDESFYEEYKTIDDAEGMFFNYYMVAVINSPHLFKLVYNKLLKAGCDKKKINDLFYTHLKFRHKEDTNQWSWNEINELELNIPFDTNVIFSKYKFF